MNGITHIVAPTAYAVVPTPGGVPEGIRALHAEPLQGSETTDDRPRVVSGAVEPATDPAVRPDARSAGLLAELGTTVMRRVDEIAERMIEEILQSDPAYRELIPREDLRASCRHNAAQLLRKVTQPDVGSTEYRTFLHRLGRKRVTQGLPLDSLLHAYRVGARVVWTGLVEEARQDRDRLDALASAATLLWDLHDSSSSRISAAYRAAEEALVRETRERRLALVDALLAGRGVDGTFRWQAASALDASPGDSLTVIVCEAGDDTTATQVALERHLVGHGVNALWRPLIGRLVGILRLGEVSVRHLARILEPVVDGRVGVSPAVRDMAELPRARQLADVALATVPPGVHDVAVLEGRLPSALLVSAPEVASLLIDHSLRSILTLDEPERSDLLEVVEQYVDHGGSVTRTADALHYHRNTVLRRVRRVQEVTGRDLTDPEDLLAFALAVKALRLVAHHTERPRPDREDHG